MTDSIYLTVIVPIRNEEPFIEATLEALAAQDYLPSRYEILVIDGRSTDRTRTVIEQFIARRQDVPVRLLDNPGSWSSRARNIGVRASRGRLIAVIDGHVKIPNNQLFATLETLTDQHAALCLSRPAPLTVDGLSDGASLWIALARKSWLAHSRGSYIYSDYEGFVDPVSAGFAYDRKVFDRVGFFDESFDAAEDVEFHHRLKRAGILAYTSPALTIKSYPRSTLRGLFHQMTRYGIGRARLIRKHPSAFTKESLIPPAVFLYFSAFPLALIAAYFWPAVALLYLSGIALYGAIILTAGLGAVLPRKRVSPAVWVALAILATHLGLGWGFVKSFFGRAQVLASRQVGPDQSITAPPQPGPCAPLACHPEALEGAPATTRPA